MGFCFVCGDVGVAGREAEEWPCGGCNAGAAGCYGERDKRHASQNTELPGASDEGKNNSD